MGTIRKRFDITISEAGKSKTEKFELDKTAKNITGLLLTSDREDLLFFRGEQKIEINGKEYFAENYESKLLMTSLNVASNNRYYDLQNAETGNGIITMTYTDHNHQQAVFIPYRVSLYVQYETSEA